MVFLNLHTGRRSIQIAAAIMVFAWAGAGTDYGWAFQADDKDANPETAETNPDDDKNPLKRKGLLQELAEPINELVNVQWEAGQIRLNMKQNSQEVDAVVDKIRAVTGYGGGSSHYGGGTFRFNLTNGKIAGHISREKKKRGDFLTSVVMQEQDTGGQSLAVEKTGKGRLKITINDIQLGYLLRVRQQPGGQFAVQELRGTEVFSGAAEDFDSFCRQHRDYVHTRLSPALEHFGLGRLQTPFSTDVQQAVLNSLRPWQDEELQRVDELTSDLDSPSFSERQAASELLKSQCSEHLDLLVRVTRDARFPPETRTRIRALIREELKPEKVIELDFIDQLVTQLDPAYLVELVSLQTDPAQRELLVSYLRKQPGIDFDAESATLVVSQTDAAPDGDAGQPPADLLAEEGRLQDVATQTGQLVQLKWHKDQLAVDREHWALPFDGQSVADLIKQAEQSVEDAHLPAGWFNPGGSFDGKSVQYPQVLFEQLQEAGGPPDPQVRSTHYYGHGQKNATPNRQFVLKHLSGRMQFVPHQGRQPMTGALSLDDKPFLFSLSEKSDPLRSLLIDETRPGELRILITGDASNFIVQLILRKDSALVQDIRGTTITAFQAESFRQLIGQQPEYFESSFFPLLRHLGIRIDDEVAPDPVAPESTSGDSHLDSGIRVPAVPWQLALAGIH